VDNFDFGKREDIMLRLRMVALIAGVLLATVFSSPAFADATLSVAPASSMVSQGSTFTVDLNITGVTDLYDYQFDLSFNPTVLQATNVLEGTFLAGGGSTFFIPGAIDNTAGTIAFNADTLLTAISGVSGSGTLIEFDFTAFAPGTSDLTILNNTDLILQDSTGALISSSQAGGSVTVQGSTAVPESSSLMMLGAGLLAIAGLTLKRTIQ
jgi:adhesin HecA-like repeat protein